MEQWLEDPRVEWVLNPACPCLNRVYSEQSCLCVRLFMLV